MTSRRETPKAERTPWGLVILLGLLTAYPPISIDLYLPSLPSIASSLKASPTEAQATVSAFMAGLAIGQLVYGPASDRLGRRAPLLLGGAIYVAASAACALATSPTMLIAARFVAALGGCAGVVVARAIVRDRFDHTETARVLALMLLVMGLAPILGPFAGGLLLALGGWRLNFWALTAFGAAITAAVFFFLKETRSEDTAELARSETPLRAYLALLKQRRMVGYAIGGALNGSALFTYIAASPDLVIGTYGISPSAFGIVFGVNAAGMIAGSQVNRWLLRRWTPDDVLSVSCLVTLGMSCFLVLVAVTGLGGKWAVLGALFALLSTYALSQSNSMAGALSVDPRRSGSVSALMGGLQFGVGALVSSIGSLFHDGTARPMALTMTFGVAGSVLFLRLLALPGRARA